MSEPREPRDPDSHTERLNGHSLVAVEEYLPGNAPSEYDVELGTGREYLSQFWQCRDCGQERNRRYDFTEPCEEGPSSLLVDGGYSVDDGRTRRALTEQMEVQYGEAGALDEWREYVETLRERHSRKYKLAPMLDDLLDDV